MSDTTDTGPVLAADGTPLKRSLARALRMQKLRALMLIAPLLLFVLLTFILPIVDMLFRSVENQIVSETLPKTVVELQEWDASSGEAPGEAVFAALAADMKIAVEAKTHTRLGSRLNYEKTGLSSLFRKSGRKVKRWDLAEDAPFKQKFIDIDEDWGDVDVWRTLQTYSPAFTNGYFLNSIDMQKGVDGPEARPENQQIYITLFGRTLFMSLVITASCILLGYPVAWILANLPSRTANLLMILVLLPFWTSLLVRTSAWKVMLQQQGVINDVLVWLGLVADDSRLVMINNQFGTIVAMTHILLPFMILPMYSVMQTIAPTYLRAAKSLGATNWTAFWRVYFPQSVPGIGAGSILVFILAIGYYITPEIVGGTKGVFISNRIAYHISSSLNWGLAAALGTILLAVVLLLYWAYDKIVGIDNVKLG
ncbi:MAG: ABC transporter permease [Rhodobacteraceae bacterium]|nr:ABC transporter permease [Paracoccaceae bacterium]